jgi:recombination protein RecT
MSSLRERAHAAAQPGTEVEPSSSAPVTVYDEIKSQLDARRSFIAAGLSRQLDLDILLGRVVNEVRKNPLLAECTFPSLMGAVVTAAQLGLEPGPLGHFYLTPRRNKGRWEVVPIIGYRGYIELARRSGGITVDADERRENDHWVYQRGTDPKLITSPPDHGARGETLGYWAAATFSGGAAAQYMSQLDLDEHVKKYASKDGKPTGFAATNWDAWCRKTVVRQMAWKLPLSNILARALEVDEAPTLWRDGASSLVTVHPDRVIEHDDVDLPVELSAPEPAQPEAAQ